MIFRFKTGRTKTKLHLRFSLHQLLFSRHTATFRNLTVKEYLCPRLRGLEWKFITESGEDLESLLKKNTKGSFSIIAEGPVEWISWPSTAIPQSVKVVFSHRDSAIMSKMMFGAS